MPLERFPKKWKPVFRPGSAPDIEQAKPSWRKPAGIFLILLLIAFWAWLVVTVADLLPAMPWPLRALFFVTAGIVWILPLKPLLRWIELGSARKWRE